MSDLYRRDGGIFEKNFDSDIELSPSNFSNFIRRRVYIANGIFEGRIQYKLNFLHKWWEIFAFRTSNEANPAMRFS